MPIKHLKIDFYRAVGPGNGNVAAALKHLEKRPPGRHDGGIMLEKLHDHGGHLLEGDFTKAQIYDVGKRLNLDTGASKPLDLDEDEGLGHDMSFAFHKPTRVFVLQRNRRSASANTIEKLIHGELPNVMLEPVFSQEIFERAMKMTKHTRSFTFKIAAPVSARFLDGKIEATADAVRIMEALASPSVEVTVSMGHQGGFLKRIAPVLSQLWKNSEDEHGHQQVKVSMKGASEDDGEIVEIPDLFADRLIVVVPTQFEGTALTASDRRWAVNNAWNQVREMVKRLYKEE